MTKKWIMSSMWATMGRLDGNLPGGLGPPCGYWDQSGELIETVEPPWPSKAE